MKLLLLEILLRQDVMSIRVADHLGEQDWSTLQAMANTHRLGPLLHWRLSRELPELPIPQSLREACAQSFRAATMRSLMLQRELLQVHRILKTSGIPHVALKGAWLAFHAYPLPGLRPLRDLDILVPEAEVFRAFQVLQDSGFTRLKPYEGSLDACARHGKHLPPLRSPSGQVNIELHLKLYQPEENTEAGFDLSDEDGFWGRLIESDVAGHGIAYLPPTELLLHVIVHAVYDHQFSNGPLLISDLAYLLEKSPIDWPRFWMLARRGGHQSGVVLALRLLERYRTDVTIEWPYPEATVLDVEQSLLDGAAELMLRNFKARCDVNLGHEVSIHTGLMGKIAFVLGKIFPPRSKIALTYPVSEHSIWVYAWYPVRWWWLFGKRLPEFFVARRLGHLQAEMSQVAQLSAWLNKTA
ncbi:MAG: nucleotidyltransferase family protein [Pseudomonadota bacterium]